jgi:hypothetical protein
MASQISQKAMLVWIALTHLSAYLQRRIQDLLSEVEWWGVYDPNLSGILIYFAVAIPVGQLSEQSVWIQRRKRMLKKLRILPAQLIKRSRFFPR